VDCVARSLLHHAMLLSVHALPFASSAQGARTTHPHIHLYTLSRRAGQRMKQFFHRHQPAASVRVALLAGIGAALAIAALGSLGESSGLAWLVAPFGASCVLLFAAPAAPFSQPPNVLGGHCLAAFLGIALAALLPGHVWGAGLAVGGAISCMMLLRIVHPPAGATALVAYMTKASWMFLLFPTLAGSAVLVGFAFAYHRLHGVRYPVPPSK
jgi:CBS-domain-containing membrane protein